mmetsp:Transcript_23942/g.57762  ORF Transcript_23942/g.57762 Transcript_23942/m.57762 type:complete len:208 (+) Transcript_23942:763-1386(+)
MSVSTVPVLACPSSSLPNNECNEFRFQLGLNPPATNNANDRSSRKGALWGTNLYPLICKGMAELDEEESRESCTTSLSMRTTSLTTGLVSLLSAELTFLLFSSSTPSTSPMVSRTLSSTAFVCMSLLFDVVTWTCSCHGRARLLSFLRPSSPDLEEEEGMPSNNRSSHRCAIIKSFSFLFSSGNPRARKRGGVLVLMPSTSSPLSRK